jgi:hypothetical protein
LARVNASLDGRYTILELVADIRAGLGTTKVVDISDGVMIGIGRVVLDPSLKMGITVIVAIVLRGGLSRIETRGEGSRRGNRDRV